MGIQLNEDEDGKVLSVHVNGELVAADFRLKVLDAAATLTSSNGDHSSEYEE